jgi:hypothetical protein
MKGTTVREIITIRKLNLLKKQEEYRREPNVQKPPIKAKKLT